MVPRLVATSLGPGRDSGSLRASVVFVDLEGFTALTRSLMRRGRQGAELVSEAVNAVYRPAIRRVLKAGGSITSFIGDAFIAVLPPGVETGHELAHYMERLPGRFQQVTGRPARVRIGVAEGRVDWAVCPAGSRLAWYVRGSAVESACLSAYGRERSMLSAEEESHLTPLAKDVASRRVGPGLASRFVPGEVTAGSLGGEFRSLAAVFICFDARLPEGSLRELIANVGEAAETAGGYLAGVFFDEKGGSMLVLLGAPVSMERARERSVAMMSTVLSHGRGLAGGGVAYGLVYAGFVGSRRRCCYTALGDVVNTAARLGFTAEKGECLLESRAATARLREVADTGRLRLPGRAEPVEAVRLLPESAPFGRPDRPELAGRRNELSQLKALLAEERSLVITGSPGVGKSHLLDHLTKELSTRESALFTWAHEPDRTGIAPLGRLAAALLGVSPAAFEAERLDRAWSSLGNGGGGDGSGLPLEWVRERVDWLLNAGPAPGDTGEELASGAVAALAWLARSQGRAVNYILAEDLQWMSPLALKVLFGLARELGALFLGTSRPEIAVPQGMEEVRVGPLDSGGARRLAARALGGEPDDSLTDFLRRRCRGNPFLLEQYCALLLDEDLAEVKGGVAALKTEPEGIPEGINEVIAARLDRLRPAIREAVVAASVLGMEFGLEELEALIGCGSLADVLDGGRERGFWSVSPRPDVWTFSHALVWEGVYSMQLGRKLRRLHRRAFEAVSRLRGDEDSAAGELGRHAEMAGRLETAWPFYETAGDRARAASLHEESLKHYRSMERCVQGSDADHLLRARGKMCVPLENLGRLDDAMDIYRSSIELARTEGMQTHLGRMLLSAGRLMCLRGDLQEGFDLLQQSLDIFEESEDEDMIGRVYSNLGMFHFRKGEHSEAERYSSRFLDISRRLGNLPHQCMAVGMLAVMAQNQNRLDDALALNRAQLKLSRKLGLKQCESTALTNLGSVFAEMGDLRRAGNCYRRDLDLVTDAGLLVERIAAISSLAGLKAEQGDPEGARRMYSEGLKIARSMGHRFRECSSLVNLAGLDMEMGRRPQARQLALRAREQAQAGGYDSLLAASNRILDQLDFKSDGDTPLEE